MASAVKKSSIAELFTDWSLSEDLPNRIGEGWGSLLIHLGFTSVDIFHFDQNNRLLKDKIGDGLRHWKDRESQTPDLERAIKLIRALRETEMVPVADKLEDEYCLEDPALLRITEITDSLPGDNNLVNETPEIVTPETTDIQLRNYQKEIAQDGLRGENSIIWAGTGSGKTRVAIYIMKKHLDSKPKGKIAFFNITVKLLHQQHAEICKLLPRCKQKIVKISGRDPCRKPLPEIIQDCRVCVLTPMSIDTYLKDGSLSLTVFSMLVFDECHHARKNEPYNQIMAHYRKLHKNHGSENLPQIIGLTATVSTERAVNVQGAVDSIINLMARLNVYRIATPKVNEKEYKKYSPDPVRESELMKERVTDPIGDVIQRAMQQLEDWLRATVNALAKELYSLFEIIPDNKRMEQPYQTWLSNLNRDISLSKQLPPDVKRQAIVITEHLMMYRNALYTNLTLSMKDVLKQLYLSSLKYKILESESENDVIISGDNMCKDSTEKEIAKVTVVSLYKGVIEEVEALSKIQKYENPNIDRLQEMVETCFKEKGKDSTFIVFVETRESAIAVSSYLEERSYFAKCRYLIGARSTTKDDESMLYIYMGWDGLGRGERKVLQALIQNTDIVIKPAGKGSAVVVMNRDDYRQTQTEHDCVVEQLRDRKINGVVATDVAEEGINIPSCNFVIRYNKSKNEISTLQSAGRSRDIHGKVVNFANEEKHRKEKINVIRLELMNQALRNILDQPDGEIKDKVMLRMHSIMDAEAREELVKEEQENAKTVGKFTLRCKKCSEFAVSSPGIRCFKTSQYVVVDREFYKKVKSQRNKKAKVYMDMETSHKIECKKCCNDWGVGAYFKSEVFCAVLKIKQFIVTDDDTQRDYNLNWAQLPFTVQSINEKEMLGLRGMDDLTDIVDS